MEITDIDFVAETLGVGRRGGSAGEAIAVERLHEYITDDSRESEKVIAYVLRHMSRRTVNSHFDPRFIPEYKVPNVIRALLLRFPGHQVEIITLWQTELRDSHVEYHQGNLYCILAGMFQMFEERFGLDGFPLTKQADQAFLEFLKAMLRDHYFAKLPFPTVRRNDLVLAVKAYVKKALDMCAHQQEMYRWEGIREILTLGRDAAISYTCPALGSEQVLSTASESIETKLLDLFAEECFEQLPHRAMRYAAVLGVPYKVSAS